MYRIILNTEDENRITRVTYEQYEQDNPNSAVVAELPEGDITDYKYIDGEYVYDPLPVPEPPTEIEPDPSLEDRLAAAESTIQTHDSEIDTILTGLEGLTNG